MAATCLGSINKQQPLLLLLLLWLWTWYMVLQCWLLLLLPVLKELHAVIACPAHIALRWCYKQAIHSLLLLWSICYLLLLLAI
jgi:hypothetical protein